MPLCKRASHFLLIKCVESQAPAMAMTSGKVALKIKNLEKGSLVGLHGKAEGSPLLFTLQFKTN